MRQRIAIITIILFLLMGFAYTAKVTVLSEEVVAAKVLERYKVSKNGVKYYTKVQIKDEIIVFEDKSTYIKSINKAYIDVMVTEDEASGKIFTSYRVVE